MNNRTKKWLVVAGCLVICVALVALIGSSFSKDPVRDDPSLLTDDAENGVTISPDTDLSGTEVKADDTPAVVIKPDTGTSTTSGNGAVSRGTEQTIQPDVTSPEPPDDETLSDSTKTPDGQPVDGSPEPVDHDSVQHPTDPPPQQGQPSGGETKSGKIYVPGFGWIENDGGGGQGTDADDMYENGNKIGIMD